jgi:ribosome-binding ATPase YchF (GTP1/OBG family)
MEADALIHVVDISGSTDSEGMIVPAGSHNPAEDIEFLEKEVDYWILGILNKLNLSKRMDIKDEQFVEAIYKQLSGLGVKQLDVDYAIKKTGLKPNSSEDNYLEFIEILRKKSKPMIVAANKIDISGAYELFEKVKMSFPTIIPCCAEAELALRRAAEHNLIKYMPGDSDFSITQEMDAKHRNALEFIRNNILKKYGSTGVQKVIDETTFSLLNMIVVYPVENEHKFTDSRGRILPDAHLIKRGTTVKEFASKIHTDFSEKYICAIDARTGKRIGDEHALQNGDIVKILIRH